MIASGPSNGLPIGWLCSAEHVMVSSWSPFAPGYPQASLRSSGPKYRVASPERIITNDHYKTFAMGIGDAGHVDPNVFSHVTNQLLDLPWILDTIMELRLRKRCRTEAAVAANICPGSDLFQAGGHLCRPHELTKTSPIGTLRAYITNS